MASYVSTQLADLQVHMEPVVNFDTDHYRILHQRLIEHEELQYGTAEQVQVLNYALFYQNSYPSFLAYEGALKDLVKYVCVNIL